MTDRQKKPHPVKLPLPEMSPPPNNTKDFPPREPFFVTIENVRNAGAQNIGNQLEQLRKERIRRLQELRQSKVVVYYSLSALTDNDAEFFYEVTNTFGEVQNLDLYLLSYGGLSDPAFKIARICQAITKERFSVLVPYYAKSAATMLALGADSIVMGPSSDLGPIDPQIRIPNENRLVPLHALRDSLNYIEGRVSSDPGLATLYWPLIQSLHLMSLGEYDREIRGAAQYAECLLKERMFRNDEEKSRAVAEKLTAGYNRHSYVIDREEAKNLGLKVDDATKTEWEVMWQLHNLYDHFLRDVMAANSNNSPAKVIETLEILLMPGR